GSTMSSPITFSGFNSIDFTTILNAVMQQASQPLTSLQSRQSALKSQMTTLGTMTTRVTNLASAADALTDADRLDRFSGTSSDAAVKVSTSANASEGHFDVVVTDLARAHVTASTGTAPDADTTVVADGGTIDIGGVTVTISGGVTMNGLASAINGTANIGVKASVIATAPNTYRLVLTGKATGAASAFTVTNNMTLTSGTALQFSATNAVTASNAKITINNIQAESATNVFDNVAPGVTLTVSKAAPATTVSVDIAADSSALRTKVGAFVSAFNE